jgi:hypothetical protein
MKILLAVFMSSVTMVLAATAHDVQSALSIIGGTLVYWVVLIHYNQR